MGEANKRAQQLDFDRRVSAVRHHDSSPAWLDTGCRGFLADILVREGPCFFLDAFILRCRSRTNMTALSTIGLFIITAIAEIVGCYLPYLWLKKSASPWVLLPAAASLALFAWLLTLHPTAAGRVYAAYGGVYVSAALVWLWLVDGVRPHVWDIVGVAVTLLGMGVIMFAPRG